MNPSDAASPDPSATDPAREGSETPAAAGPPAPGNPTEPDAAPAVSLDPQRRAAEGSGARGAPSTEPPRLDLIPFVGPSRARGTKPRGASALRVVFDNRRRIGAIAAGVAAAALLVAGFAHKSALDEALAFQNSESQSLADTVRTLEARLGALETSRRDEVADLHRTVAELRSGVSAAHESGAAVVQANARAERLERDAAARRDEIAELRKSVTELRNGLAASHDAGAALAQFSARADRLEHDEDARIEKLGERIDHDATVRNADLAGRLDKLEKKFAPPAVAALAPAPPALTPSSVPKPPAQPVAAAKVSNETTGSIAPPRAPIRGWTVREIHDGLAIVEGPWGFRRIGPGDRLPGVGRVERVERTASGLTVVTDQGVITGAPFSGAGRSGPDGAFNYGYGPPGGEF